MLFTIPGYPRRPAIHARGDHSESQQQLRPSGRQTRRETR